MIVQRRFTTTSMGKIIDQIYFSLYADAAVHGTVSHLLCLPFYLTRIIRDRKLINEKKRTCKTYPTSILAFSLTSGYHQKCGHLCIWYPARKKRHDTSYHIKFSGQPRVKKLEMVRYFLVEAQFLSGALRYALTYWPSVRSEPLDN